jgi:hypothetical protein
MSTPDTTAIADTKFEKMDPVPIAQKYHGAWLEYNARVTARYNLTQLFLGINTALLAFLLSTCLQTTGSSVILVPSADASSVQQGPPSTENKSTTVDVPKNYDILAVCAIAIPLTSLIYSLLMLMHDGFMRNLKQFMAKCETYDEKINKARTPNYHSSPAIAESNKKYRLIQNVLLSIVIAISSLFGLYCVQRFVSPVYIAVFSLVTVAAVYLCWYGWVTRFRSQLRLDD